MGQRVNNTKSKRGYQDVVQLTESTLRVASRYWINMTQESTKVNKSQQKSTKNQQKSTKNQQKSTKNQQKSTEGRSDGSQQKSTKVNKRQPEPTRVNLKLTGANVSTMSKKPGYTLKEQGGLKRERTYKERLTLNLTN